MLIKIMSQVGYGNVGQYNIGQDKVGPENIGQDETCNLEVGQDAGGRKGRVELLCCLSAAFAFAFAAFCSISAAFAFWLNYTILT